MNELDRYDNKIGLALTKDEFSDIISCVDEVQQRMDVTRDKGWGSNFNAQIIERLQSLVRDLKKIKVDAVKTGESDEQEYKGLPKEHCEVCE